MTYDELWRQLATVYGSGEAKAIVRYVLDVRFGMSATDVYCGKVKQLTADESRELREIMLRLSSEEPVQYVLGRADFCGRTFRVGPDVLIPRPETEELCGWIVSSHTSRRTALYSAEPAPAILDIGTGSGCIAITLALDIKGAKVSAWDLSPGALAVAGRNASALGAEISFAVRDALNPPCDTNLWDAVVSNPPYICDSERAAMERNVLDHEPHMALFVPDDDPLRFYRPIAGYARKALKPGGALYLEINPLYAGDLRTMLCETGFGEVEIRNDSFGKERFAKATVVP